VCGVRAGSDHTPLLSNFGEQMHREETKKNSFELYWFRHEGFLEIVAKEWATVSHDQSPMEVWQHKILHFHKVVCTKGKRERLLHIIDSLDLKAKITPLNASEREVTKEANEQVSKLRRVKETKWAERIKVTHI
jgi:hypothetical protein